MRLIDSCITQLKAQGPSRTCSESKEEEEDSVEESESVCVLCFRLEVSGFRFQDSGFESRVPGLGVRANLLDKAVEGAEFTTQCPAMVIPTSYLQPLPRSWSMFWHLSPTWSKSSTIDFWLRLSGPGVDHRSEARQIFEPNRMWLE